MSCILTFFPFSLSLYLSTHRCRLFRKTIYTPTWQCNLVLPLQLRSVLERAGRKEARMKFEKRVVLESINRHDKADKSEFDRNSRCGCSTLPPLTPPSFTVSKYEHQRIRMSGETTVRIIRKIVQSLFNRIDEEERIHSNLIFLPSY